MEQSGQKSRTGKLAKSGSTMLRWAAIEAAQQAWRPSSPWHQLYRDVKERCGGKGNPAKAAVARKVLIASWHVLALQQPFSPSRPRGAATLFRRTAVAFWPPDGPQRIEQPRQLRPTRCAQPSAERELSNSRPANQEADPDSEDALTAPHNFKENATSPTCCPNATAIRSARGCERRGR